MTKLANKFIASIATVLALQTATSLAQPAVGSQTLESLNAELESANSSLEELDNKALNCMNSFSMNLGEAAALLCDEFLRAIDGELLANYINRCGTLKSWRDDFVNSQHSASEQTDIEPQNSEEKLALMVGIEYSCGENALSERTQYVVAAFNTLEKGTLLNQSIERSFKRTISELQLQSRLNEQGQSLQNSVQLQGQRQQEANQQQMQRLETELIRQQINNPR